MFYRELYTGTWFGPGYGGFLSGRIVRADSDGPEKGAIDEDG